MRKAPAALPERENGSATGAGEDSPKGVTVRSWMVT